ncbi:uncharacterized protein MONOS_16203 [Monocercomonoides exilis]|uniref:uncharacterized protein n=1 Tax=Monocercomonoides exilis TaxID=2049356 RepID=UPI00355AB573|nr:hypothetical protein MONOS_16203 [Monocercomonoides exilis]|eukprot:MONOS_16203.1-p1 / transcript=MONOS_16203.1 / gene=MONOS_16203 / organism=Monocercomonoides_exilis_PA203 / gene_product=unspecified product / transcript_product=unspecified product / location=Mono_scaffold01561:5591-6216(+) / protein_length=162 / sequence_SO=supercontig / SO=protein_coding / is_pseudo=false
MQKPVFGERSKASIFLFWFTSILVGGYSIAILVIAILYTVKAHYQLIFYALMALTIVIIMLAIVIPWRRHAVEEQVRWVAIALIPPLFFAGLTVFLSLSYDGDKCVSCSVTKICVPKTKECVECPTGYYMDYTILMSGKKSCLKKPDPPKPDPKKNTTRIA